MRGEPSENLVNLLARLKLATAAEVHGVAARVKRLAGDLPDFESVWVDALAQSRVLTPFQSAEINAGRGDALAHGPYVILHALGQPHYAACFAARHVKTQRIVRLYVVHRPQVVAAAAARALTELVDVLAPLRGPAAAVVEDAGITGDAVWAACSAVDGTTAAEWMAENGRFPPHVVLHVARKMLERLAELERLGVVHGDVCAAGLLLQRSGQVVLPMAGLRGIVRAAEGYSFGDLQPEVYDYLAPERIAEGSPPSIAGDLYACGCLWWHLLTGRPPFAGGNSLAKLKAVHAARVVDVRQLAPEVPQFLAAAIEMCMAREPTERPRSMAELSDLLGPPERSGGHALDDCLNRKTPLWHRTPRSRRRANAGRRRIVASVATVSVLIVLGLLPLWRRGSMPRPNENTSAVVPPKTVADARQARKPATSDVARSSDADVHVDPAITPASATARTEANLPEDLILPSDKILRLTELDLKSGRHVRGRLGQRPLISMPSQGIRVACEDVYFDGIDFIWEAPTTSPPSSRAAAMIVVEAQAIEFRGCSFSTTADDPPCAIAWSGCELDAPATGGELALSDCVFSGLAAVVDCRASGGLSVEVNNSLCVASGPLVRLDRAPAAEQSIAISLDHATMRGDSAVLECGYGRLDEPIGPITITANDSALAGNPQGGLLVFTGAQRPDRLLKAITWNGSGSLVTEHTAVAVWRGGTRNRQTLSEDDLEVAGLVRSRVEFSGSAEGPPSASRVIRWQGPLRSADPPGANANSLYLPRL